MMNFADRRRKLAASTGMLGAALMMRCSLAHYCMCGHLAHSAAWSAERWEDLSWVSFLGFACVFATKSNMKSRRAFYGLLVGAVAVMGFVDSLVAVPFSLGLLIFCLIAFFRSDKEKSGPQEQVPGA